MVGHIEELLEGSNITKVAEGVNARWPPGADDLAACRRLGRIVAEAILAE